MIRKNKMIENIQQRKFEGPEDEIIINDLETLKVLSDPLRMQIIELMGDQPRTVKQIAQQLELTPNKLYYHIKQLEGHRLIRVVETRLVSGIVEKHYQTSAKEISVAEGLLSISKPEGEGEIEALISSILDGTKADFKRSLRTRAKEEVQAGERHCSNVTREMSRLTPEQAKTICKKLEELVKEFESYHNEENGDCQTFALTTLFYPSFSLEANLDSGEENE
jgi:DNA-binding transcriptional ArsR family regulator